MISDGCTNANRKVLIERVGDHLRLASQAWRPWRPGPPVAAPSTGNRHIGLFRHVAPGQAVITRLHDLIGWMWHVRKDLSDAW
jgi:hypothetical protein